MDMKSETNKPPDSGGTHRSEQDDAQQIRVAIRQSFVQQVRCRLCGACGAGVGGKTDDLLPSNGESSRSRSVSASSLPHSLSLCLCLFSLSLKRPPSLKRPAFL